MRAAHLHGQASALKITSPAGVLRRLSQLCQAGNLRDVVQRNLFPSGEMVLSLRKLFHTERLEDKVHAEDDVPQPSVRRKKCPPLDTHNRDYMMKGVAPCKNFIQVWSCERLSGACWRCFYVGNFSAGQHKKGWRAE